MRLIDKFIRTIAAPARGHVITWDDGLAGFGLRTTAAGVKSFILNYRNAEGRERRMTLGRWPELTATAARERAAKLKAGVMLGSDPLDTKQERRVAPTFGDIAAEYLEKYAAKKKSGYRDREYLERDVLPHWKSRKAASITRRDVIEIIECKAERAPIAANRLLATVRKLFNWAVSRDVLLSNPCVQVAAPGEARRRDRVLRDDEIATCWRALETGMFDGDDGETRPLDIGPEVRAILRLTLVTAARPGEVCEMAWADINGDWWTVPAERSKNGLSHRIPLTELAKEILDGQARDRIWIFGSRRGGKPIQVNALTHGLRRADHFGLPHFTAHDLRRTAATGMGSLGVNRFVLGRILNHVETGVTAIYDRSTYDAEKRQALEKWERKLRAFIGQAEPAEVVGIA